MPATTFVGRRVEEFDVTPDGQRIAANSPTMVESYMLVLDWPALLRDGGH